MMIRTVRRVFWASAVSVILGSYALYMALANIATVWRRCDMPGFPRTRAVCWLPHYVAIVAMVVVGAGLLGTMWGGMKLLAHRVTARDAAKDSRHVGHDDV